MDYRLEVEGMNSNPFLLAYLFYCNNSELKYLETDWLRLLKGRDVKI